MAAEQVAEVRWLDLDRDVRRRVKRAVGKGVAVDDPRDAALAVGYAEASLEWLSNRGRLRPFHLLLCLLIVVELLFTWTWSTFGLLGPLVGFGFLRLRRPVWRRNLLAACEANAEVAAAWSVAPVQVLLPGHSWLYPGRRGRRKVVILLASTLALLVLVVAAGMAGAIVHKRHWAAKANRVCAREHARLARLHGLEPDEQLRRRIPIERDALVGLGEIGGHRTPLESRLIEWRRYEVELDAWLLGSDGDPRLPAEQRHRAEARGHAQALARRLGASTCARV
jgi:hypothetical protein